MPARSHAENPPVPYPVSKYDSADIPAQCSRFRRRFHFQFPKEVLKSVRTSARTGSPYDLYLPENLSPRLKYGEILISSETMTFTWNDDVSVPYFGSGE